MKKDAYYFPHDSNAKDDPKCILLLEQLGCEGYGIFWILIETLRDQHDWKCPLSIVPALARRYNTSAEKINVVIKSFGLFEVQENEFFFSESFTRRMLVIENKRLLLSNAGKLGNEKRWGNNRLAIAPKSQVKEIKGNKRKENNNMSKKHDIKSVVEYLNKKTGFKYRENSASTSKHINARYDDGYSLDDFKKVIDIKSAQWLGTEMQRYLRPETLFNETKFQNYINERPTTYKEISKMYDLSKEKEQTGITEQETVKSSSKAKIEDILGGISNGFKF